MSATGVQRQEMSFKVRQRNEGVEYNGIRYYIASINKGSITLIQ